MPSSVPAVHVAVVLAQAPARSSAKMGWTIDGAIDSETVAAIPKRTAFVRPGETDWSITPLITACCEPQVIAAAWRAMSAAPRPSVDHPFRAFMNTAGDRCAPHASGDSSWGRRRIDSPRGSVPQPSSRHVARILPPPAQPHKMRAPPSTAELPVPPHSG